MSAAVRPRLAVFKLASCDGCQLQLLQSADALTALAGATEIVHFPEALSEGGGPYDIALVEGSVSTTRNVEEVRRIRDRSGLVVTIGACATAGGVQALRNVTAGTSPAAPYPSAAVVESLATSTPVADHIKVDLEVHGCPVDAGQLLGALAALLAGSVPRLPAGPVCQECRRRGFPCVIVVKGEPCLGPVTRAGCGAICPGAGRGCYGCFGAADTANTAALSARLAELGAGSHEVADRYRMLTPCSPAFEVAAREVSG